jgi:hypothetical protein
MSAIDVEAKCVAWQILSQQNFARTSSSQVYHLDFSLPKKYAVVALSRWHGWALSAYDHADMTSTLIATAQYFDVRS